MKVSIRRASFCGRYLEMSKPRTSPAIRTGKFEASKRVIVSIPDFPATIFPHASSTVFPTGETMPRPVTTTLRVNFFFLYPVREKSGSNDDKPHGTAPGDVRNSEASKNQTLRPQSIPEKIT
jgi:hypothetical protein